MQEKNWTARITAIGYLLGGIFVFGGAPAFGGTAAEAATNAPLVQLSVAAMPAPCGGVQGCLLGQSPLQALPEAPILPLAPQTRPNGSLQAEVAPDVGIGQSGIGPIGAGTF